MTKAYGIDFASNGHGGFQHTAVTMVIDPQGQIHFWLPPDVGGDELLKDVQLFL